MSLSVSASKGRHYGYGGGLVRGRLAVALLVRARVNNRNDTEEPADEPAQNRTRSSTGTGRAVLRTMRTVNDIRAIPADPVPTAAACCAARRSAPCASGKGRA